VFGGLWGVVRQWGIRAPAIGRLMVVGGAGSAATRAGA